MAAKAIPCLVVCFLVVLPPARAQTSATEALYALNSIQPVSLTRADFGRFFDAGARGIRRADEPIPPRVELVHSPDLPPAKSAPFVIDIPAVPPAPFARTFHLLQGRRRTNGYDDLIRSYALKRALDPRLVKSVIAAESEFAAHAQSPAGALGLMQVMPTTAGAMGVSGRALFDPEANIRAGTAYLAYLFERAWRRYHLRGVAFTRAPAWLVQRIIAAYNAGPRFLVHRRLYRQTREYVKKVLLFYRSAVTELREKTPIPSSEPVFLTP